MINDLQTSSTPVTVFRSSDDSAPQLTNTAGSLTAILKACLVDGYGSKSALGWTTAYENSGEHKAAFRAASGNQHYLHILNADPRRAVVTGYRSMSDIDTGNGMFTVTHRNEGPGDFPYLAQNATNTAWILIGYAKAFIFVTHTGYRAGEGTWIAFGEFPSYIANDTNNTLLSIPYNSESYGGYDYIRATFLGPIPRDSKAAIAVAQSYDGWTDGGELHIQALTTGTTPQPYPDAIGGGLIVSECYLREHSGFRGLWPGITHSMQDLSAFGQFAEVDNFIGTTDKFVYVRLGFDGHYLINTTAWMV